MSKQTTKKQLEEAIHTYFETLKAHGRTVSKNINPERNIIEAESKFLPYLDDEDLVCWFCYQHLVVIQIDYKVQRPVWGCLKDRATKGLQKIKWLNHCGDCGRFLRLENDQYAEQEKYLSNGQSFTVCDKCIGNGNILTGEDMKNVHKKVLAN